MNLSSLYRRLGILLERRGNIEEEIKALSAEKDGQTYRYEDRLVRFEQEYQAVQDEILSVDHQINQSELTETAGKA